MKAVIQCCKTKSTTASFRVRNQRVKFVVQPKHRSEETDDFPARPDERMPNRTTTWREQLVEYNDTFRATGQNPLGLKQAFELYAPKGYTAYSDLLRHFSASNMYILSAGWGLVRADFLLPDYDITFRIQDTPEWCVRKPADAELFHDFAHLTPDVVSNDELVYFFGGGSYLQFFFTATSTLPVKRVVYYSAKTVPDPKKCRGIKYDGKGMTWMYRCASDFCKPSKQLER